MIKSSVAVLQRKISTLKKQTEKKLKVLEEQLLEKKRKSLIVCQSCRKRSPLSSWAYVQDFWHTPPSGCSGGDYWNRSVVDDCYIVCPKCKEQNRILLHTQQEKIVNLVSGSEGIEALFSEVQDQYNR